MPSMELHIHRIPTGKHIKYQETERPATGRALPHKQFSTSQSWDLLDREHKRLQDPHGAQSYSKCQSSSSTLFQLSTLHATASPLTKHRRADTSCHLWHGRTTLANCPPLILL